ncbi:radical SAM protein [Candidatus Bathyarchaeota archaeon]|nr:MAG: radical SAM protein [Candidatus Bathyarchaeota archaeon]
MSLPREGLRRLLERSRRASWRNFGKKIWFYAPGIIHYESQYFRAEKPSFAAISVTGSFCALKCDHCRGQILRSMLPATSPSQLVRICRKLKAAGVRGCLISGGCLPDGSVPLRRFTAAIAKVVHEIGMEVIVHTGLLDEGTAVALKDAGVSAVLFDVIGSEETIREVYHLRRRVEDYERTLEVASEVGIPSVPHVVVGLHYGRLLGELEALEMIARHRPAAVVVVALMPLEGTPMEHVRPPSPQEIARVLAYARSLMPSTPIVLGCARPRGPHRTKTDILAIMAGANAIAFPSDEAVQVARALGLDTRFSGTCCAFIFKDIRALAGPNP